jgi:hypothetical protein
MEARRPRRHLPEGGGYHKQPRARAPNEEKENHKTARELICMKIYYTNIGTDALEVRTVERRSATGLYTSLLQSME